MRQSGADISRNERFGDEVRNPFRNKRRILIVAHYGAGSIERKARGKNGKATQYSLFSLGQEIITPVEGSAERLMASNGRTPTSSQQPEAIVEVRSNVAQPKCGGARRGELD